MKIVALTALSLFLVLVSANAACAKEWRGIIPLHSTRADVERLLGAPTKSSSYASYYGLPDEIAVILYQTESCDSFVGKFGMGWNIPSGTVTSVGVIPKGTYRKERFVVGNDFQVENAHAGFSYYTNAREGLSVETYHGIVTTLSYLPTKKEDNLRCPRVQECCVDFFPRFDEYENLSFEDEKARLDNYANEMKERLGRGVIVVYGKNRDVRSKIVRRAERAKKYLAQKRGIEPQRILIVDGGYREYSATELDLHPIGGEINRIYLFPERDPEERDKSERWQ